MGDTFSAADLGWHNQPSDPNDLVLHCDDGMQTTVTTDSTLILYVPANCKKVAVNTDAPVIRVDGLPAVDDGHAVMIPPGVAVTVAVSPGKNIYAAALSGSANVNAMPLIPRVF